MANRRARIHEFYSQPGRVIVGGTPAAASGYAYRGAGFWNTVVVRCDLNRYSAWARDKTIEQRVNLLNDFFSTVVPLLEEHAGVYFRDEGDCIVSVFSGYFGLGATPERARAFCQAVVSKTYGTDELSAKAVVAFGSVAYFQKSHEIGSDDWSAEGQPFVTAARLEQAIESRPHIVFFQEEYDQVFAQSARVAAFGGRYYWEVESRSLQVPGLGLPGGWTDIFTLTHIPGGRIQ
ncbi:MAG TPA: hypothetical protein VFS67_33710 [Polyangiaceae bacterium]|nr:hypothetical protein [Polyangiaceae bacterium]